MVQITLADRLHRRVRVELNSRLAPEVPVYRIDVLFLDCGLFYHLERLDSVFAPRVDLVVVFEPVGGILLDCLLFVRRLHLRCAWYEHVTFDVLSLLEFVLWRFWHVFLVESLGFVLRHNIRIIEGLGMLRGLLTVHPLPLVMAYHVVRPVHVILHKLEVRVQFG